MNTLRKTTATVCAAFLLIGAAHAEKFDLLCEGTWKLMDNSEPEPDVTRFSLDTDAMTIRFKRITGTNEWAPTRPLTVMPDRYSFFLSGPVVIDRKTGAYAWPNGGQLGGGAQGLCKKVEYSGDVETQF